MAPSFCMLLAALLLSTTAAHADVKSRTSLDASTSERTTVINVLSNEPGVLARSASGTTASDGNWTVGMTASANSDFGIYRLFTQTTIAGPVQSRASADLQVNDRLTFLSDGLSGTTGFMNASFLISGTSSLVTNDTTGFTGAGTAWTFDVSADVLSDTKPPAPSLQVASFRDESGRRSFSSSSVNGAAANPFGLHVVSIPFTFGEALDYQIVFAASAFTYDNAMSSIRQGATLDLSQSIHWGGVSSVTTADGGAVPYALSSESGYDWTASRIAAPVPEPRTYALMLTGLGLLGAVAKRRTIDQSKVH